MCRLVYVTHGLIVTREREREYNMYLIVMKNIPWLITFFLSFRIDLLNLAEIGLHFLWVNLDTCGGHTHTTCMLPQPSSHSLLHVHVRLDCVLHASIPYNIYNLSLAFLIMIHYDRWQSWPNMVIETGGTPLCDKDVIISDLWLCYGSLAVYVECAYSTVTLVNVLWVG